MWWQCECTPKIYFAELKGRIMHCLISLIFLFTWLSLIWLALLHNAERSLIRYLKKLHIRCFYWAVPKKDVTSKRDVRPLEENAYRSLRFCLVLHHTFGWRKKPKRQIMHKNEHKFIDDSFLWTPCNLFLQTYYNILSCSVLLTTGSRLLQCGSGTCNTSI